VYTHTYIYYTYNVQHGCVWFWCWRSAESVNRTQPVRICARARIYRTLLLCITYTHKIFIYYTCTRNCARYFHTTRIFQILYVSSLNFNPSTSSDSSFSAFFWIDVRNTSYWSVAVVGRALVSPLPLSTMSITVSAAPLTHSIWWLPQSLRWQNVEQYGVRLHKEHSANASLLQLAHWNLLHIYFFILYL